MLPGENRVSTTHRRIRGSLSSVFYSELTRRRKLLTRRDSESRAPYLILAGISLARFLSRPIFLFFFSFGQRFPSTEATKTLEASWCVHKKDWYPLSRRLTDVTPENAPLGEKKPPLRAFLWGIAAYASARPTATSSRARRPIVFHSGGRDACAKGLTFSTSGSGKRRLIVLANRINSRLRRSRELPIDRKKPLE